MYGHAQPMTMHNQIATDDDDASGVAGAGAESIDNPHIRYDAHALDDTAGGVAGAAAGGGVVDDVNPDAVYGGGHELVVQRNDGSSQLTLSFRGQVYVFDAVTPDKVWAFF